MPQHDLPSLAARICARAVCRWVAAALFAPQHPVYVAAAVDEAWRDHEPAELLEARLAGATAYPAGALAKNHRGSTAG